MKYSGASPRASIFRSKNAAGSEPAAEQNAAASALCQKFSDVTTNSVLATFAGLPDSNSTKYSNIIDCVTSSLGPRKKCWRF